MTDSRKTSVALGSFDGLHTGHRAVIACALSKKECGLEPVALLFDSHPLLTLTGKAPAEILQPKLRAEMLEKMGIRCDYISFPEIKDLQPQEFFDEIIIKRLNAGAVVCGWNYSFGSGGAGNCETLRGFCDRAGVELSVLPHVDYDGSPVSSSRIRQAITQGDIAAANAMLGFEFRYRCVVKSGFQRGRLLGAPTINQYFDPGFIIPKKGVYASVTVVDGAEYASVTNIGLRPSFENEDLRSETCIIGFDGNLYGREIEVRLISFLRGEQRFNSAEALSRQISLDADKARELFSKR